ncbi:hypothetical protein GCM10018793_30630 [Streptomyces sulfonofaciens]|uniref:Iron-containing redox enzyme family protein n=1 Tax=Streptomyces sulfonofaciens TaxID=68272 RepID=A0A919L021_9ACTN|nr:hypothetical protein [Streptomyces sulfonofaciens]GHH79002.1 hypothetical protein GCM10018793_30630 [Streptomyces sulfonofaciens]
MAERLSALIDAENDAFTKAVKGQLLESLPQVDTESLEWLVMEHYQFSFANKALLQKAVDCTRKLADTGVSIELQRNVDEEDGHAPMYKKGMLEAGTDMDSRVEFPPTTRFLAGVDALCAPNPSRALGSLYATETAAIFEHEVFHEICKEIADRRGFTYEGSLIKRFHDIHLEDGVEQGHKDGLAAFVDLGPDAADGDGEPIDMDEVRKGALEAIAIMRTWWDALLKKSLGESVLQSV